MDLISNNLIKAIIVFLVILLGLISVNAVYNSERKPAAVSVFNPEEQSKDKLDKENLINHLLHFDIRNSKEILQKAIPILGSSQQKNSFKEVLNDPIVLINQASDFLIGVKMDNPASILQAELPNLSVVNRNMAEREERKTEADQKETFNQKRQAQDEVQETELNFTQTEPSQKTEKFDDNNLVGIYYTHTSESYEESVSNFHSKPGTRGDVVEVGRKLIERLESKHGINALHSTRVNDSVYRESYMESRETARQLIEDNPNLQMVFDIHRDALAKQDKELFTTTIDGQKVAKVMIVVAKANKNYGLSHPEWRKNLRFAYRLADEINSMYPNLLRKVKVVDNRRYNQDLHPHSVLLEIGGVSNTSAEAKRSTRLMADVIASLLDDELNN
ncbi:stage II sporulation protein P [Acetohalobium arabaticum]|uniref:Stage II sporulation protein P n=1 Tax=Acetohalobium arabaticum (strain ATCC 49924 / DSM 5501 / Z-7288) TaxID=574087 RepID=D9QV82_ACEAZ|nr:stage II sporulation protein P [Acetohalobium arabaticum]ADL12141.1 stage II sporulation protein P [Acetohalobium arabaticum DSM 5501]